MFKNEIFKESTGRFKEDITTSLVQAYDQANKTIDQED
jgi:hypothetical protein